MLAPYLLSWNLSPTGPSITTPAACLQPVTLTDGRPAMLRVAHEDTDTAGTDLLQTWSGNAAVRIYAREGRALLMEYATGRQNLTALAQGGDDEIATHILCETAHRLHRQKIAPPDSLISLQTWFHALTSLDHEGLLATCADMARRLLKDCHHPVALHGDLHHGNVLDFGTRGWLAIDPKGLWGDPAFEYAAIFTNPDLGQPQISVAANHFERRFTQIARLSGLPPARLRDWIVAGAGLSAAWFIEDDDPMSAIPLDIVQRALSLDIAPSIC